jgi:hypothetical protein
MKGSLTGHRSFNTASGCLALGSRMLMQLKSIIFTNEYRCHIKCTKIEKLSIATAAHWLTWLVIITISQRVNKLSLTHLYGFGNLWPAESTNHSVTVALPALRYVLEADSTLCSITLFPAFAHTKNSNLYQTATTWSQWYIVRRRIFIYCSLYILLQWKSDMIQELPTDMNYCQRHLTSEIADRNLQCN